MTRDPVHLSRPLEYVAGPCSPPLEFGRSSLAVRLVPATTPSGHTLALCGACNVEHAVVQSYQGRLLAAIRIVAVHAQTGAVASATALDHDAMPLRLDQLPQATTASACGDGPRHFEGIYFTVDLAAHLQLPPEGAEYDVFAWLDDLVSSMERGAVPADTRRGVRGPATRWLGEGAVQPLRGAATEAALRLALREDNYASSLALHIPDTLRAEVQPRPVSLLVQAARSRMFVELAIEASIWRDAATDGAIALDFESLGMQSDPDERLHCIAMLGGMRSAVLRVPTAAIGSKRTGRD